MMKMNSVVKALVLVIILATFAPVATVAQTAGAEPQGDKEKSSGVMNKIFGQDSKDKKDAQKKSAKDTQQSPSSSSASEKPAPGDNKATASGVPTEIQAGRREQLSEEEASIVPYYNNYLTNYRLGPEDVISIEVFNQPRYSKSNITVPPDGRISVALVPEGVRVVGKTTQQVQEEIQKKMDEYIIDPQVTVYLDKAMSARYSVLGDVTKPGIMIMTRRVSVMEAIAEAGGVLNTGDKKKVMILRHKADGSVYAKPVNIAAIEKGQVKDMDYLVPGDQIIVPGNRLKSIQQLMNFVPILAFGRIFGLPF
jgi:polysaccharide export outer membrane protein